MFDLHKYTKMSCIPSLHLYIIVICAVCVCQGGSQEPSMETSIIRMNITQGKNAIMPCMIDNMDERRYKVTWRQPDNKVISIKRVIYTRDRRFRLLQPYPTDWNIELIGARSTDSGVYSCMINTEPEQVKKVHLHVQVPARIQASGPQEVQMGGQLVLYCNASGDPAPTVAWYKPGRDLSQYNSGMLVVEQVGREDTGNFRCEAHNGIGPVAKATIAVDVMYAPHVVSHNQRIGQYRDKDSLLVCHVTANPAATVSWYKHASQIMPNWKYRPENVSYPDGTVTHSLTIRHLNKHDFGDYICMASNKIASSSVEIKMFEIKDPPKVTTTKQPAVQSTTPPATKGRSVTTFRSTTTKRSRSTVTMDTKTFVVNNNRSTRPGSSVTYSTVTGHGKTGKISSQGSTGSSLYTHSSKQACTILTMLLLLCFKGITFD